jgi:hypothetical protein
MSDAKEHARQRLKEKAKSTSTPLPKSHPDINTHLKTRKLKGNADAILKASRAADNAVKDFYHTLPLTLKSGGVIDVEVQRIGASVLLRATTQPYLEFSQVQSERTADERRSPEAVSEGESVVEHLLDEKGDVLKRIVCEAVVSLRLTLHTMDECEDMNAEILDHYELNPDELTALASQYGVDEETALATKKVYSINLFDEMGLVTFYQDLFGLTVPESEVDAIESFRRNGTGESDPSESVGTGDTPPESDVSIDAPTLRPAV